MSQQLSSAVSREVEQLIVKEDLPADFGATVAKYYLPIATQIFEKAATAEATLFIGVNGSQGSGKSTFATFLELLLENQFSLNCLAMSIDDFYLTRASRLKLAQDIHPLFATRGVPGTHDTTLLKDSVNKAKELKTGQTLKVPVFNKAIDDRSEASSWTSISGPVNVVILEGWCVGVPAQSTASLKIAVNELEQKEDRDLIWRTYVNRALSEEYKEIFATLDGLVLLNVPGFSCVHQWRELQEQKLLARKKAAGESIDQVMDSQQIARFIQHYQRLTEHGLSALVDVADWVLDINQQHQITALVTR